MPFRAGREEKIRVAAGFFEASGLIGELTQCNFFKPAMFAIRLRRSAKSRVIFNSRIIQLNFSILQREAQKCNANGFGRGFQVVESFGIAPGIDQFAVTRDVPGTFSRKRIIAGLFESNMRF